MRKRYPELTANLASNPLPASFDVVPKRGEDTEAIALGVQKAKLAGGRRGALTARRSRSGSCRSRARSRSSSSSPSSSCSCASTILIANTIRLSIFARRREIEVMKLVGATNWFVRGPFMLEGVLTGLVGSLAAVILLFARHARSRSRRSSATSRTTPDVRALLHAGRRRSCVIGRARDRRARLGPHAPPLPPGLTRRRRARSRGRTGSARRPTARRAGGRSGRAARSGAGRRRPSGRPSSGSRLAAARASPSRERVVAHLGPTNSGRRTPRSASSPRSGARRLRGAAADARAGGAPALSASGSARSSVGLVTGEERVNERAPVDLLDRRDGAAARRAARPRRGAVGGRRPSAARRGRGSCSRGEYREILLLGALDALPLVERAFPERELKVFERKLPLEFVGERGRCARWRRARSSSRSAAGPCSRSRAR